MSLSFFKSCVFRMTFFAALCFQAGCSVLAVADAAVSVATVVKTRVNAVGAAVDTVLPSKDKK